MSLQKTRKRHFYNVKKILCKTKTPRKIITTIELDFINIDLIHGYIINKRTSITYGLSGQELMLFCILYNHQAKSLTYCQIAVFLNSFSTDTRALIRVILVHLKAKLHSSGIVITSDDYGLKMVIGKPQ